MTERNRALNLNVRLTEEERVMLAKLAAYERLSQSDVVRRFILVQYRAIFGEPKPTPAKKGARR